MIEINIENQQLEKIFKTTRSKLKIQSQIIDIAFDGKAIDTIWNSSNGTSNI